MMFPSLHAVFAEWPWMKFAAQCFILVVSGIVLTYGVKRARLVKESDR
jgi:hypothetical protein